MAESMIDIVKNGERDFADLSEYNNSTDTKKVIRTRKGNTYKTHAGYIADMLENGVGLGFQNLTELQRYRPSMPGALAKDMSTRKIWRWDGSEWHDTGESDLDLSVQYTDKSNSFRSDFYDGINDELESYFIVDKRGYIATILGGGVKKESDFFNGENDKYETLTLTNSHIILSAQMVQQVMLSDFYDTENDGILALSVGYDGYFITKIESAGIGFRVEDTFLSSVITRNDVYTEQGLLKKTYNLPHFYYSEDRHVISSSDDVYSFYDNLMRLYPGYVTKTDLGTDSVQNHIYEYKFTPPVKRIDSTERPYTLPIKMTIIAGIHGSERNAMIALMSFCHNICREFNSLEYYGQFRASIQFAIIPLLCPSGLNRGSRLNSNGVDLNRNFPTDWDIAAEPKGSNPLSEPECQIALSFIESHADSICNLSLHGHGLTQSWFWMASQKPWTLHLSNQVLDEMFEYYHSQMPFETDPEKTITYLGDNTPGTLDRHIQKSLDRSSILLEFGTANEIVGNSILNARVLSETMIKKTVHKIKEVHHQSQILNSIKS